MTTALAKRDDAQIAPVVLTPQEQALLVGDLSALKPEQRASLVLKVCESVGLNPLTRPLEYISLNGKLTLYARKDATDQLRKIHNVSLNIASRGEFEGCYAVTARAKTPGGREDESLGAVPIANLKGEALCNAMMKAETKAKRRVTLSICGLGFLDETELETIPNVRAVPDETPATEDDAGDTRQEMIDEIYGLFCSLKMEPKRAVDAVEWASNGRTSDYSDLTADEAPGLLRKLRAMSQGLGVPVKAKAEPAEAPA